MPGSISGFLRAMKAMKAMKAKLGFNRRVTNRTTTTQRRNANKYDTLESRRVLASIFFDAASSDLFISGDAANDNGSLVDIGGGQVRASIDGAADQTFASSQISQVFFIGGNGNDTFTNQTSIPAGFFGGAGDDVLTGGSANDNLNGGSGNDQLNGGGGDDRLVGLFGNDEINGGDGNDSIFGSAGINTIRGGSGDDIIFGGDQVDTIFGEDGIDQIFGLGGDDFLDAGDGGVAFSQGIDQADLILGLDGNDTITGGNGLNVLWGGNGDDIITGGNAAENRLHGQAGNDELTGGNLQDFITVFSGVDTVDAAAGNDFIVAGPGNDNIDGGAGTDILVLTGNQNNYRINESSAATLNVRDLREGRPQGDNATQGIENLGFANVTAPNAPSSVQRVVVRPIVAANSNGSNAAAFFGDAETEAEIKALIDDIYAQANIDIEFEPVVNFNNTFTNVGNPATGARPQSDLEDIVDSGDAMGIGSSDPNVVDAYFVQRSAGFDTVGDNTANGLAFVGGSGTTIHIGDNLLGFQSGLEVIAGVVAHEIGHNLGLDHLTNSPANLLYVRETPSDPPATGDNFLTQSQVEEVLDSSISQPI